jgi:hypothetical protein
MNFLLAKTAAYCVNLVCSYDPFCCEVSWDAVCQELANALCVCPCCDADLSGDSVVNGTDLGLLIGDWGLTGENLAADLNKDWRVDGADLGIFLQNWGSCQNLS